MLYIQYLIYFQHLCGACAILSVLQVRKWRQQKHHWFVLVHTAHRDGTGAGPQDCLTPQPCATLFHNSKLLDGEMSQQRRLTGGKLRLVV